MDGLRHVGCREAAERTEKAKQKYRTTQLCPLLTAGKSKEDFAGTAFFELILKHKS